MESQKSWIWDQYLSKNMNRILLIRHQYLLQNIQCHFCFLFSLIIILLGTKQASSHRAFITNGILQWWNLDIFWKSENLKNIGKSYQIKHIVENLLTFCCIIPICWVQNNWLLPGLSIKNGMLRWWNLDKSLNP